MAHKLVIVESPAKARTIGGYLGQGYVVESSIGHIRDLPQSAAETPAKIKDKPWGRLAVDVDNGFEPYYVVPRDKKAHISKLKTLLKDADELYLATDEDREGEAIAWHLLDELKPKGIPVHRMVFHEITKAAILEAVAEPARARRRTSSRPRRRAASSTASTATRSARCCGRRSCPACPPAGCSPSRPGWSSTASASGWRSASRPTGTSRAPSTPAPSKDPRMFPGKLHSIDERPGRAAAPTSATTASSRPRRRRRRVHLDRAGAEGLVDGARATRRTTSRSVEAKPYRRSPYAPFRTTTLQQEASRKLGMSASVTMSVAQRLYENGFITYMRTDSTTLSGARGRRGPVAGARAVRRGVPPRRAAHLRQQGQERPGGARGDPPVGRDVPHARRRPA